MNADRFVSMIVGPTASGKSSIALRWAVRHSAELLSADSRQVYRFMDIGTATPTADERARVRHHFVNERDPDEPLTAAQFALDAEQRIADLHRQNKPALVVGGSTLYLHALKDGLSDIPEVPPGVRAAVAADLERHGLEALVAEFQSVDAELARETDLRNPRRVLRALEVYRYTGKPLSTFRKAKRPPLFQYCAVYLRPERTVLYRQIEQRVDRMVADGLVAEVARLLERGYSPGLPALQSIGYAEIIAHLDGRLSLDEAISAIKTNTRRYAKRQLTYFNKYFADAVIVDPARIAPDDGAIDRMFSSG